MEAPSKEKNISRALRLAQSQLNELKRINDEIGEEKNNYYLMIQESHASNSSLKSELSSKRKELQKSKESLEHLTHRYHEDMDKVKRNSDVLKKDKIIARQARRIEVLIEENAKLKKDKLEMLELMGSGVSFMEEMISNQKNLRNIVANTHLSEPAAEIVAGMEYVKANGN